MRAGWQLCAAFPVFAFVSIVSALDRGPDPYEARLLSVLSAIQSAELELAHELYDRVIAIQPDYAEAYNRRASVFLLEENMAEALRDVNEALRLEPRHFGAWTGLGRVLEELGAKDEALAAYREAVRRGYRFYSYGDAMLLL